MSFPQLDAPESQQPTENLVGRVMRAVNDRIREDGLKIGESIPSEAALAASTGVSRTVVREALRSLATLGIVEIGNGRRARVGGLDDAVLPYVIDHAVSTHQISIQQIYDVRRTIEMRTVVLAALRRTEAEAREITRLAVAMEEDIANANRVMEHDIRFHEVIARASRNPLFALIVTSFHVITRQTWGIGWSSRSSDRLRHDAVHCHQRIASAIENHDPKAAEALMAEHFDNSVKALLDAGVI